MRTLSSSSAVLVAALLAALLVLAHAASALAAFAVETAEPSASIPSLVLDSQEKPRIAFKDGTGIGYIRRSGGNWIKETVTTATAEYVALDLDASDTPSIAFTGVPSQILYYATKSGGVWTIEQVDAATSRWVSLAVDAQGNPHIAYSWFGGVTEELRRARKNGGAWTVSTVDASSFGIKYTAIAFDSQDRPHISYLREGVGFHYAVHAFRTASAWTVETADGGAVNSVLWTSIAIDAQDDPHMSYTADGRVNYASRSGGVWTDEDLPLSGTSTGTSIDVDGADGPHITLGLIGNLYYARKSGGAWITEQADGATTAVGEHSSLVMDAAGVPRVAYEDDGANGVNYAFASAATGVWSANGVDVVRAFLSVRPNVVTSGSAAIFFSAPAGGAIDLSVFDAAGRRVATLPTGRAPAGADGAGQALWDGRDEAGRPVASGTYFLRLVAGAKTTATERLLLVR